MTKKMVAFIMLIMIVLTGCGAPNKNEQISSEETKGLDICFLATADVDDGNFVQHCYEGVEQFLKNNPESKVTTVIEPDFDKITVQLDKLVKEHSVFVLPGYVFSEIGDLVKANPDVDFIVVDTLVTDTEGNAISADNLYTMRFREEESGFLVGVAAALESKSNKVAVINALPEHASNIDYQYGFKAGVNYTNAKFGTSVEYVDLPEYAKKSDDGKEIAGNYIGSYIDLKKGKEIGQALIDNGVDVIFSAAGLAGNGAFDAIKEADQVYAIGLDRDQYEAGQNGEENIILTSAKKGIDHDICRRLTDIYYGLFEGQNAVLDAGTDSTGYYHAEGRHQLSDDTLEKMETCYNLVKDGVIIPPSSVNGYTPTEFPGF